MMKHSIFAKELYDRRWFMLGWSLGFIGFAALMVSFYPAMHQDGALDSLVENMPPAFEGLIGNLANLKSFDLYLASQMYDIRLPLVAGIMAIVLGLTIGTREEGSGELRTLLALPVSRTKVLVQKWLALLTVSLVTVVALGIGIYAIAPFIKGAELGLGTFFQLELMTWLLMITYGTIAFAVGMATGSKGLASTLSILIVIGSFIITTFAPAVEWLEKVESWSLIHYFPAVDVVNNGIALKNIAVLGGLTLALVVVAIILFRRRDIKT